MRPVCADPEHPLLTGPPCPSPFLPSLNDYFMNIRIEDDVVHLPDGQRIFLGTIRAACAGKPAATASFNLLAGILHTVSQAVESPAKQRVLITVSGGVADYIADQGVDVRIYDRDNALEGGVDPVPVSWADLARPSEIPVEGDDDDVDDVVDQVIDEPQNELPRARSPRMR